MSNISSPFADKRILIVDDQGSIRSVFKMILQEVGFENIDSATDGADAIEFLKSTAYDLVICDWNMPKMSGVEVLRTIRECEQTEKLPFMMVTSASEVAKVRTAMVEGVSDYLIKPFQPASLSKKAVELLAQSKHIPAKLNVRVAMQN